MISGRSVSAARSATNPVLQAGPRSRRPMKRVDPEMRFFDMDASHPIFHAFFEIDRLDGTPQNIGCPPM